jgi:hypothetical protein
VFKNSWPPGWRSKDVSMASRCLVCECLLSPRPQQGCRAWHEGQTLECTLPPDPLASSRAPPAGGCSIASAGCGEAPGSSTRPPCSAACWQAHCAWGRRPRRWRAGPPGSLRTCPACFLAPWRIALLRAPRQAWWTTWCAWALCAPQRWSKCCARLTGAISLRASRWVGAGTERLKESCRLQRLA